MLVNEAGKIANLTKKAIEYYTEQGLVAPAVLENGYRDYNEEAVERLQKIYVLRKLELSTEEIKDVLDDKTGGVLQKLSVQKELKVQREKMKHTILDKLSCGKSYSEIRMELKSLEQNAGITEKLLEAFPGYYGRFISLHFARFLNEPIRTEEQQSAYLEIIAFLDNAPALEFPEDLKQYFDENTKHIGTEAIALMIESTKQSMENPHKFLAENKEILNEYLTYLQSDEYKNSPACKIKALLKTFNNVSGYYDIFIPAMKKLSSSYEEYMNQMDAANELLLSEYPEIAKLII
jgi:DNA-binding transcriptional MerR regulator